MIAQCDYAVVPFMIITTRIAKINQVQVTKAFLATSRLILFLAFFQNLRELAKVETCLINYLILLKDSPLYMLNVSSKIGLYLSNSNPVNVIF